MTQPSSLLIVDADLHGLETLTYGFEREGCKVTRTSDLSRAVQLSRTGSPALSVVMLREPAQPALDVIAALHGAHRGMPILALGSSALQTQSRAAGAAEFLHTPTFIRDVVNVAKLCAYGDDGEGLLSEYHGLFYLLRAMSATSRSCVLRLSRGSRRGEIRFKDGKVVSAGVRALQHLPALHHMLLWEEARVSVSGGPINKPSQFPLSSQEVLDECERFLRDFAHAARDLGPPNTIYRPIPEPHPAVNGLQPNQMAPLLRLFDGKHGLSDVVEESPFRIFDTIRMIRRLVEGGVLTTRTERRPTGPQQRISRPVVPLNGGAPQSMLGQWAMVPDQRGVVGDRRSPSRPLMPFGRNASDQPGAGGDRRSPSRPVKPLQARQPMATPGPTPLPTPLPTAAPTPAPIPLTHKKVSSGEIRSTRGEIAVVSGALSSESGDIPPVKRRPTPGGLADLELGPTVQVKVDVDGTPLEMPVAPRDTNTPAPAPRAAEMPAPRANNTPAPAPVSTPPVRRKTPTPSPALEPTLRSGKTPPPSRLTPAAAFNAVEADFFAREADLYKRETVDTFDDLDSSGGRESRSPSKTRRRRK
jgi:hypothetical protein